MRSQKNSKDLMPKERKRVFVETRDNRISEMVLETFANDDQLDYENLVAEEEYNLEKRSNAPPARQ